MSQSKLEFSSSTKDACQRCPAHRMSNLAAKVPEEVWPEFKTRVQAAYQAPSRAITGDLAAGVVTDFERRQVAALRTELNNDYEAQIGLEMQHPKDATQNKSSSKNRT